MERIVIGLPDFTIEKVVSVSPIIFEVRFVGKAICPDCGGDEARIKDTFWRFIKNIPLREGPSTLKVKCHKHICRGCGRYFNTRLPGVKLWSRTTELLKSNIFRSYNKGYTCKDIAVENNIGTASVERYYHQMMKHEASHWKDRPCPRMLGIDEHRFTRKQGFSTTFCDLGKHRIFDVTLGKSAAELESFLRSLKGRERVRVVCINMNSAYRSMVEKWFPNARIVSDRFHVIRLINQHLSEVCKKLDEPGLAPQKKYPTCVASAFSIILSGYNILLRSSRLIHERHRSSCRKHTHHPQQSDLRLWLFAIAFQRLHYVFVQFPDGQ